MVGIMAGKVVTIRTGRVVAVMASIKTTCGFSSRADLIRNIFPLMSLLRGGGRRGRGKRKTKEMKRNKG